jgi:hypothetical protein
MKTRVSLGVTLFILTSVAQAEDFHESKEKSAAKLGTIIFNETWGRDHGFVLPLSPIFDGGGKQLFDILHPEPTPKPTPDTYWRSPDDTTQ